MLDLAIHKYTYKKWKREICFFSLYPFLSKMLPSFSFLLLGESEVEAECVAPVLDVLDKLISLSVLQLGDAHLASVQSCATKPLFFGSRWAVGEPVPRSTAIWSAHRYALSISPDLAQSRVPDVKMLRAPPESAQSATCQARRRGQPCLSSPEARQRGGAGRHAML